MSEGDRDLMGGQLSIPDGWFVDGVNFDDDEPSLWISNADAEAGDEDRKLAVPKCLAYYLSTHACGSEKMKKVLTTHAKNELRSQIKRALEMETVE